MPAKKSSKKPYVVVRTYSAGVHCGELVSRSGKEVVLANARRIWKWQGAWTLSEVASKGIADTSKVSCEVPEMCLPEAIEVATCTEAGEKSLRGARWTE